MFFYAFLRFSVETAHRIIFISHKFGDRTVKIYFYDHSIRHEHRLVAGATKLDVLFIKKRFENVDFLTTFPHGRSQN